ncbi:MAG: type III polyketide synthase [Isosphaeraceae bacterium]
MSLEILGVGTSVPPCALSQGGAAELTSRVSGHNEEQAERLAILYGLTGITRRHVAILDEGAAVPPDALGSPAGPSTRWRMARYEDAVASLALKASREALAEGEVSPSAITHLVTVSCTGFASPGFDLGLIAHLGLNPSVERTHVGFMGCHGAMNGLRVARAFASTGRDTRILLCAAELCSLHFSFGTDADKSVSNALFADGAAAIVAAPGGEDETTRWRVLANGSVVVPNTEDAMSWRIGDNGFEMTLSPDIAKLIRAHLPAWLETWLAGHGLRTADIASWAIHPGGPRILDAVQHSLGLEKEAVAVSRQVLAGYGNMSSPTVLFILDRLIRQDAPRPCVTLGFGPGLVIEAALIG